MDQLSPSTADDSLQKHPYADDSILICSVPEDSSDSAAAFGERPPDNPPTEEQCLVACGNPSQSLFRRQRRSVILKRKSRCAKIGSTTSDEEIEDDSVKKQRMECGNGNPNFAAEAPVGNGSEQKPPNLLDVVKMMSKKPDRRLGEMDILEIAAMKGIDFPPPRWWRPGGYEAKVLLLTMPNSTFSFAPCLWELLICSSCVCRIRRE
ncbi:hypothetical protein AXF42_Ash010044 [Apostasia shenzhenica]|uniref:Uncharacterized protein n=1 Tax=Apostasia shenzhenica TaxID=1088818 RepID=A0A2I0ACP0_9ASPA|nr:hypothetical protein AXF42_Ash010044 [Apostasia shenzhenica]